MCSLAHSPNFLVFFYLAFFVTGLTICGIDHLPFAQWVSEHKIVVQLAKVKLADRPEAETDANGRRYCQGPVLVTTGSGGISHQTLQFTIEEEEEEDSDGMVHIGENKDTVCT